MKRFISAVFLFGLASAAFGQSYPSPHYKNVTIDHLPILPAQVPGVFGVPSGASALPSWLTPAQTKAMLAIGFADVSGILPVAQGGTGTATPSLVAGANTAITGTFPSQTVGLSGIVPLANGGTGTAAPALVAGTGIALSGSFPAQTVGLAPNAAIGNLGYTPLNKAGDTAIGAIAFTAGATVPTMTIPDNSTNAASTAFVKAQLTKINVLNFSGCDPTGVTDSTTCIQNAVNAIPPPGGVVYIPPGLYKISSAISVSGSNEYIEGSGPGVTVVTTNSATAGVFNFSGYIFQGLYNIELNSSVTQTAGAALVVNNVSTFHADNVQIFAAYNGINIISGTTQFYNNITIDNSVNNSIYVNGGNDQYLSHIVAYSASGSQPIAGIHINNTGAIWIDSVDMINQGTGLLVNPAGSTDSIMWLFVSNSAFDSGTGDGISLSPGNATASIYGSTFVNDWTSSNSLFGIEIGGVGIVNGIRFVGHRSFNNVKSGITIDSTSPTNITFDSCDVSGNSSVTHNMYSGFDISAGASGFSIINSRSGQEANFALTQSRGILINPGSSNNYTIANNDLRGNLSDSLLDGGTGTTKIVKGNLGYNPLPNTGITVGASPFTWTNNTGETANAFISGGVVSSVKMNGVTIGAATNSVYPVTQGSSVVVTYTTAPAMSYSGY